MPRELFENLEFDLPAALLRELIGLLDDMQTGQLDELNVNTHVPEEQGVYQLFLDNQLVYIGKTDSDAGLNNRLRRHAKKIQQRQHLDPARVTFKAVRVYVFTAMDLEQQLIGHYQASGTSSTWNKSGFGANDPGRKRDFSKIKDTHFDRCYPINIDLAVNIESIAHWTSVSAILAWLKNLLPYTLRYESLASGSRQPHRDLLTSSISLTSPLTTLRDILLQIKAVLPLGWQITLFPGYVIAYKEHAEYPHGLIL